MENSELIDKTSWGSYPKVHACGHRYLEGLFDDEVTIEEKIDGSQFSFGIFNGEIRCKSRNNNKVLKNPDDMFNRAITSVMKMKPFLVNGWTYRAEYLTKPKHNTLAYDRVPKDNLMIFDINDGYESYLTYEEKFGEAARIGLECVPLLHHGKIEDADELMALLERESILGGQKIEGFVIKNHLRFGMDDKAMIGKYVSEAFKEKHGVAWKNKNPGKGDMLRKLVDTYKTDARWDKAIQHLKEAGELEGSPKDIGPIIREILTDIKTECGDEIKEELFAWAWKTIQRGLTKGVPEYYKEILLRDAFEKEQGSVAEMCLDHALKNTDVLNPVD
ncbi:MAG: hypothetical protein KAR06_00490 [Deltaproteobacteria bacterium]|nr:hypothetical protein [Deltaproteobacteria bacterium]